jgi:hypothetical protein
VKLLKKLVLLALLLALLFGAGLYLSRNGLVALGIERAGESALGTPTTVDKVRTGLFSGDFALGGLRVANPTGFSDQPLFELGTAGLGLPLARAFDERIEVERLAFSELVVRVERKDSRFNFQPILDHLGTLGGGEGQSQPAPQSDPQGSGREILIKELAIESWRLELDLGDGLTIPPLELDQWSTQDLQIGGEGASPLEELIARITEELLLEVTQLAPDGLDLAQLASLANVQAALAGDLDGLVDQSLAEVQSQAEQLAAELQQQLDAEIQGLTEGLGDQLQGELDELLPELGGEGSPLQGLGDQLDGALQGLGQEAGGALEGLGGQAEEQLEGAAQDVQKALDDAVKEGSKGLEGLLKGGILKGSGSGR